MDEIWARVGLILGALAVAASIAFVQRRRVGGSVRQVEAKAFQPGVYFFSSANCSTCDQARTKLDSSLGATGYTELIWEQEPGPFGELGVEAVPAVVIVDENGKGRLYPGQPDRAINASVSG